MVTSLLAAAIALAPLPARASTGQAGEYVERTLTNVACVSTTNCYAIGTIWVASPESFTPFIDHYNGVRWTHQTSPQPADGDWMGLDAIACPRATTCFAVGWTKHRQTERALLEVLRHGVWQVVPNPFPTGRGLGALTCTGATSCTGIGALGGQSFASRWNGHAWKTMPAPSTPHEGIRDIECRTLADCTAVGQILTDSHDEIAVIEHWNGTSWENEPAPLPSGAHLSGLTGVACATASTCFAAGVHDGQYLMEKWDGHAWSLDSPQPGAQVDWVTDVACPTTAECIAVGDGAGERAWSGYIERWNGTAWASQWRPPPPTPEAGMGITYNGVDCPAANVCLAVGEKGNADVPGLPVSARYDGHKWTLVPTPEK